MEIDQDYNPEDNDSEEIWKQPENELNSKQLKVVRGVNAPENRVRKYSNDSTHDASHWGAKLNLNKQSKAVFGEPNTNGSNYSNFSVLLKAFQICQNLNSAEISRGNSRDIGFLSAGHWSEL